MLRPTKGEEPSSGGKRRTGVLRPTEGLLYRNPKVEESNYIYIYSQKASRTRCPLKGRSSGGNLMGQGRMLMGEKANN